VFRPARAPESNLDTPVPELPPLRVRDLFFSPVSSHEKVREALARITEMLGSAARRPMIVAAAGVARSAVTASRTREMAREFVTTNGAAFSDALFLSYLGLDPFPPPGQQLHGAPWFAAPVRHARHAHHDGEWP